MAQPESKTYGMLARFETPGSLMKGCEKVRDAGYKKWDAHSPFPVHGLDGAMGLRATPLPWLVLIAGLGGAAAAMAMQWWIATTAYPLVISGKPFFSWQAFVPVTFEVGVLGGALAAVLGVFGLCKLPMHWHPLFNSKLFERATDDGFFISIESWDPKFNESDTRQLLETSGAVDVEIVSQ
jgi:hypothetical protein